MKIFFIKYIYCKDLRNIFFELSNWSIIVKHLWSELKHYMPSSGLVWLEAGGMFRLTGYTFLLHATDVSFIEA